MRANSFADAGEECGGAPPHACSGRTSATQWPKVCRWYNTRWYKHVHLDVILRTRTLTHQDNHTQRNSNMGACTSTWHVDTQRHRYKHMNMQVYHNETAVSCLYILSSQRFESQLRSGKRLASAGQGTNWWCGCTYNIYIYIYIYIYNRWHGC